jgi:tetratricopeptide (TPR) repeat protein
MDYYFKLSQLDDAADEAKSLLKTDPDNVSAISSLSRVYILKKDFKKARQYVDMYGEKSKDDPYRKISYYDNLVNLDIWHGKFKSAIDNCLLALDQAFLVNDSQRISNQYTVIADNYRALDKPDSALYYSKKGYDWATQFQTLEYPFLMVLIDPANEPEARPLFDKAITNFRSKIPQEMWNLADMLQAQFDAIVNKDTLQRIENYKKMFEEYDQDNTPNLFELGQAQVLVGEYEEGRNTLMRLIEGENETSRGYYYISSLYYIGIANEALELKDEAIKYYREVLSFWGNPEIELKEITDCRKRLANLQKQKS